MPTTPPNMVDANIVDWLRCLDLPDYIARVPAGHLMPVGQDEIWVDAQGAHLTRAQFISKYKVDPQVAWRAIKLYRKAGGPSVRIVRE